MCVCIFVFVYILFFRVYSYLYLKGICVFASFSGFTCCSLSSSPHQPAFTGKRRRRALRLTRSLYKWDFNPLNGISGRVCEFWPRISVFLPRMNGKKCMSSPRARSEVSENHLGKWNWRSESKLMDIQSRTKNQYFGLRASLNPSVTSPNHFHWLD